LPIWGRHRQFTNSDFYFLSCLDISEILHPEKIKTRVFNGKYGSDPYLVTAANLCRPAKASNMSKDRPLFGPPEAIPAKVASPPAPTLQPAPVSKPPRQQPKP
jgi:hypothetical protein